MDLVSGGDLRDLIEAYRADLVGLGRRPRGVTSYATTARRLLDWVRPGEPVRATDLTQATLRRWRNARGAAVAPATVHAELCVARSFCRFLLALGVLGEDPTAGLPFPRLRPSAPRPLQRAQVQAMLTALGIPRLPREHGHTAERARLGVYVFLYTGLRLAEVAALRWGDVDLDGATITVREGKGGRSRAVPIHPTLEAQLRAAGPASPERAVIGRRDGQPMHPKSVAEIFTRWLRARGVKITPHQLRHTFATTMLRAGAPLPDIQHALGHASLETTQMYLLVDASHLRRAVGLLPGDWA